MGQSPKGGLYGPHQKNLLGFVPSTLKLVYVNIYLSHSFSVLARKDPHSTMLSTSPVHITSLVPVNDFPSLPVAALAACAHPGSPSCLRGWHGPERRTICLGEENKVNCNISVPPVLSL